MPYSIVYMSADIADVFAIAFFFHFGQCRIDGQHIKLDQFIEGYLFRIICYFDGFGSICRTCAYCTIGVAVKKDFFVNPAIFATMDQMVANDSYRILCRFGRNVLQNGLSVDQTNFMDFCRQTNYRRYYTVDHRQYSVHILNPD